MEVGWSGSRLGSGLWLWFRLGLGFGWNEEVEGLLELGLNCVLFFSAQEANTSVTELPLRWEGGLMRQNPNQLWAKKERPKGKGEEGEEKLDRIYIIYI